MLPLDFSPKTRRETLAQLLPQLEHFYRETDQHPVSQKWDMSRVQAHAQALSLETGNDVNSVLQQVVDGLTHEAVHSPHPGYLGLFNPRSNFASTLAELMMGIFNPQLAAWSNAPFACEIERYLIRAFGEKFGYASEEIDGTFGSGGAESNLTAVFAALNHAFPNFHKTGLSGVSQPLSIYVSAESHHSIAKAAKITGMGSQAIREVPVTATLQMDLVELERMLLADIDSGFQPLMLVGTAGTTGAGAIDPLAEMAAVARRFGMWFHVDAAYGGASIISPLTQRAFRGIEQSDSITLDAHKWFSTGMGASLFLTSKAHILHQSFGIQTAYMPPRDNEQAPVDPYVHSAQWSRRFIGLKLYLPLAIHGWEGYREVIEKQMALGNFLKQKVLNAGLKVLNFTKLPVVCFTGADMPSEEVVRDWVERINHNGKFWVSAYPVRGQWCIRACITNYNTDEAQIEAFVRLLMEVMEMDKVSC